VRRRALAALAGGRQPLRRNREAAEGQVACPGSSCRRNPACNCPPSQAHHRLRLRSNGKSVPAGSWGAAAHLERPAAVESRPPRRHREAAFPALGGWCRRSPACSCSASLAHHRLHPHSNGHSVPACSCGLAVVHPRLGRRAVVGSRAAAGQGACPDCLCRCSPACNCPASRAHHRLRPRSNGQSVPACSCGAAADRPASLRLDQRAAVGSRHPRRPPEEARTACPGSSCRCNPACNCPGSRARHRHRRRSSARSDPVHTREAALLGQVGVAASC
jgi:hypothetical protein